MLDAIEALGSFADALRKAGKGEPVAGHKYLLRKPDGKGGWKYSYKPPADHKSTYEPSLLAAVQQAQKQRESRGFFMRHEGEPFLARVTASGDHLVVTGHKLKIKDSDLDYASDDAGISRREFGVRVRRVGSMRLQDVDHGPQQELMRLPKSSSSGEENIDTASSRFKKAGDAIGALGLLIKAGKGEPVAGHKYLLRKPDGKGGWKYSYKPPADHKRQRGEFDPAVLKNAIEQASHTGSSGVFLMPHEGKVYMAEASGRYGSKEVAIHGHLLEGNTAKPNQVDFEMPRSLGHYPDNVVTRHGFNAQISRTKKATLIEVVPPATPKAKKGMKAVWLDGQWKHVFPESRWHEDSPHYHKAGDAIGALGLLIKAKGDTVAGHKYLTRKPDGRGGWYYVYSHATPAQNEHAREAATHSQALHHAREALDIATDARVQAWESSGSRLIDRKHSGEAVAAQKAAFEVVARHRDALREAEEKAGIKPEKPKKAIVRRLMNGPNGPEKEVGGVEMPAIGDYAMERGKFNLYSVTHIPTGIRISTGGPLDGKAEAEHFIREISHVMPKNMDLMGGSSNSAAEYANRTAKALAAKGTARKQPADPIEALKPIAAETQQGATSEYTLDENGELPIGNLGPPETDLLQKTLASIAGKFGTGGNIRVEREQPVDVLGRPKSADRFRVVFHSSIMGQGEKNKMWESVLAARKRLLGEHHSVYKTQPIVTSSLGGTVGAVNISTYFDVVPRGYIKDKNNDVTGIKPDRRPEAWRPGRDMAAVLANRKAEKAEKAVKSADPIDALSALRKAPSSRQNQLAQNPCGNDRRQQKHCGEQAVRKVRSGHLHLVENNSDRGERAGVSKSDSARPGHKYLSRYPDGKGGYYYRYADAPGKSRAKEQPDPRVQESLAQAKKNSIALQGLINTGKLKGTVASHVTATNALLRKHAAALGVFKEALTTAAPESAKVKARVKEPHSVIGKIVKKTEEGKARYQTAHGLQDMTGARIVCKSVQDVKSTVENLKKKFTVVEGDDYVDTPKDGAEGLGYRSHHLILRDKDGLEKEVQIRTPSQDRHADWCHNVYKPVNEAQLKIMEEKADEIAQYARDISGYFYRVESGKMTAKVNCPESVKATFGCL